MAVRGAGRRTPTTLETSETVTMTRRTCDMRRAAERAARWMLVAMLVSTGGVASAERVAVQSTLDRATYLTATKQKAYLRIGLTGGQEAGEGRRAPMNVALVIDKSGSMAGQKITRAKEAARAALDQLGPDDIVSVVAYDQSVTVLVPATKVSDRSTIERGIERLSAGGTTALFAGTVKGAAEVRKFLERGRVNRVVLLSDGRANVGPSSPRDLASLGTSLQRDGIAVTTVGLGLDYNEDLMVQLARRSGGQHVFVERASDLARIFREGFGCLASIVAQEVEVRITVHPGFRPVRALAVDADILGQTVTVRYAQLYGGETDEILVELETERLDAASREVASVEVSFHNLATQVVDRVSQTVSARFSSDAAAVEASARPDVMVKVVERLALERNELAIRLRDEGRIEDARRTLEQNRVYLQDNARRYKAPALHKQALDNDEDKANLEGERWNKQRKRMTDRNDNFRQDALF